ncbi:MAG: diguanylate cyclase [Pseudobutyrivibrio sp.]|nr:diguanylate cyclase [Pseudobutyrivibrio sp.]
MKLKSFRRAAIIIHGLFIIIGVYIGFIYSNDFEGDYREQLKYLNEGWIVDGNEIEFPYGESKQTFTMTNTLPAVDKSQYLVLRAYYQNFTAYIDGKEVAHSVENTFLGHKTVAGNKEIWVPLLEEYSGKDVTITMTMRKELYGASVSDAFVTSRALYSAAVVGDNIALIIFFAVFTVTGIIQIVIAGIFANKASGSNRRSIFGALFYAGTFSVVIAQWLINDSRLPFIMFGHIVGFSILTIISYQLMPLLFFRMQRYLYERDDTVDYILGDVISVVSCMSVILAVFGIIDWGVLVYLGQLYLIIVFLVVGFYSIVDVIKRNTHKKNLFVSYVNVIFIVISFLALVLYIINTRFRYFDLILLNIYLYVIAQVFLIYKRIAASILEQQEHTITKFYAYNDELTRLGNRRKFYRSIDEIKKKGLSDDFTVVMIDSNRLKYYNDTFGHEAGDELIVATAKFLQETFEAFPESNICRIGGDEFAISLIATREEIDKAIIIFKTNLAEYKGEYVSDLSASVGYAKAGDYANATYEELQAKADEAMYKDKQKFYEATGLDRRK